MKYRECLELVAKCPENYKSGYSIAWSAASTDYTPIRDEEQKVKVSLLVIDTKSEYSVVLNKLSNSKEYLENLLKLYFTDEGNTE